jgi:hypothetical protein
MWHGHLIIVVAVWSDCAVAVLRVEVICVGRAACLSIVAAYDLTMVLLLLLLLQVRRSPTLSLTLAAAAAAV